MDISELVKKVQDTRPEAGINNYEGFIGTQLHTDYKNEITIRIFQLSNTFSDPSASSKVEDFVRTQGGIMALEMVLDIFEYLLTNRKMDLANGERKDEKDI